MCEFTLKNKEKQFQKDLQNSRKNYQYEIDQLQKHIQHISGKMATGKIEKDMIKSYRNEIEQLKSAVEFHRNNE